MNGIKNYSYINIKNKICQVINLRSQTKKLITLLQL